jgi:uncharacterized protein involved in exopolysaccharide biosynthesis
MKPSDGAAAPAEQEIDFAALVGVLWAYRVFIVLFTGLAGAIAVVLALVATPIYRADVVVSEVRDDRLNAAVSQLTNQLGSLASLAGVRLAPSTTNVNARAVLESRRLAEEFTKRNELVPKLLPDAMEPTLWMAVQAFRARVIEINNDVLTGTIVVSVNWPDPAVAAEWANGYVVLCNELVRQRAIEDATRNIEYLHAQLDQTTVVELQRVIYNLIENETKALMVANVRDEYAFAVIDPAVPPEMRSSPRRTLMVIIGLGLGGLLSAMLAVAHNLWRSHRSGRPSSPR